MAKAGMSTNPRRRRRILALVLGALVIGAVGGVLVWQDKANQV